jgi:hypothetical protein
LKTMGLSRHAFAMTVLGAVTTLVLTLSSCASGRPIAGDSHGARSVVVLNPVWESGFDECINDDAVETAIQSADLPVSRISLALKDDATAEDAKRIVDCLRSRLQEGTIELNGED